MVRSTSKGRTGPSLQERSSKKGHFMKEKELYFFGPGNETVCKRKHHTSSENKGKQALLIPCGTRHEDRGGKRKAKKDGLEPKERGKIREEGRSSHLN